MVLSRRGMGLIVAVLALIVGLGCDRAASPSESSRGPHAQTELESRLAAALQISGIADRDAALGRVAEDAATSGQAQIAGNALQSMSSISLRDKAAAEAALKLAAAGKWSEANNIAQQISNTSQRDATLKKLAEGG